MKSTRLGQWTIESLIADSSGNASVWLVSNSSGDFGALKIRAKINRFATSHQFCRPLRRDLGSLLIPFPALVLALSMFGSFIFGFWYHFLSQSNDNVTQVHGSWHSTFLWTAMALAVIELAGTVVGFRMFRVISEPGR